MLYNVLIELVIEVNFYVTEPKPKNQFIHAILRENINNFIIFSKNVTERYATALLTKETNHLQQETSMPVITLIFNEISSCLRI